MGKAITERAAFDAIRYASVWEDADVLVSAFKAKEGGAFFSIASGGDNALALLTLSPRAVYAADVNDAQLACLALKKVAFAWFAYEETLAFLGVRKASDRVATYKKIRERLDEPYRSYWDAHLPLIKRGIIHAGKFERYFALFRRFIFPFILGSKSKRELFREKSREARIRFYETKMNTWRWRALFNIFFSRTLMGLLGRDPAFFSYVEGSVASRILTRAAYALTELPTHTNPYLDYILNGNFTHALPRYLRREHYETIQRNLSVLHLRKGYVRDVLGETGETFDAFNLSDIFEYMDEDLFRDELTAIFPHAKKGALLAYWNMLVPRKGHVTLPAKLCLREESERLFKEDKAFFYQAFCLEEVL